MSEAVAAFRVIALRLIDRERTTTLLAFCALIILFVVAIRVPAATLARIPDAFIFIFTTRTVTIVILGAALTASLAANVVLTLGFIWMRRIFRAEINRMAEAKRTLEERLDPTRPSTYLTGTANEDPIPALPPGKKHGTN